MTYCLDTNTLIDAWYFWYAPDTHPTFWEGIEDLAERGRLMIPEQVLQELGESADDLYEWCRDRKDLLVHPATDETEAEFRRLVNAYPEMTGQLGLGNDYADLYVVAIASVNSATVVTTEDRGFETTPSARQQRGRRNYKITNVCHEQGIELIRPYKIIRQEGWVFSHI